MDHKAIENIGGLQSNRKLRKGKKEPVKNILTALLLKLHDYTSNLKYQQGKKILGSGASSSLHIEAEEDVLGVIPLNFLHLSTAYIYY